MKHEERRRRILEAFALGPQSVPSLSKLTQVSKSGCFTTIASLLVQGEIEFVGTQKSSSPWGGQPMRVFRLTGTAAPLPPPPPVTRIVNAARTYWKPQRARSKSGSGQIAGPITIPQYRWGSGRLG